MKHVATFALLAVLSIAWSLPAKAQEGISGAEFGRQSREAAKKAARKQQELLKKAAKKQRKAVKKYVKAQRKEVKKSNRHAR